MSEKAEGAVIEAVIETPQAEAAPMYESGMGRAEIIERLMGGSEYEPETVPEFAEEVADVAVEGAESPAEPPKPVDNSIPGLEPPKPAEPILEPQDDVLDASAVQDAPGAGKFRVRGPDGAFMDAPDLKIEFQIGEKVYKGKGIPDLVRMAYDGVAGQRATAHAKQLETDVIPRLQYEANQRITQLQADYEAQIALNSAILSDASGETWAKNHEQFAQSMSPEKVAERAQQEARQLRNDLAEQQARQYTQQVYATQVQPLLNVVAVECPDVSDHTRAGIIADLTKDLLVSGRIPPERFPELVNRMQGPYANAVRAEQRRYTEARQQVEATVAAQAAETAATLRAAQAKQNALVAGMKPVGGVPGAPVQKPLAPPKNRAEALERIINRPLV